MKVALGAHRANVFQTHRLPSAGVVGHGEHHERDVRRAHLGDQTPQRRDVHVALEGMLRAWIAPFGNGKVDGARARVLDVGARGVEVAVAGHHLAGTAHELEEDPLAGTALMGGKNMLEPGESADRFFQNVPAAGPRV